MALIYRSQLNVDSPTFVDDAPRLAEDWLRWKLRRDDIDLDGSDTRTLDGAEVQWTNAHDGDVGVFRALVFEERKDVGEQLRTTFTAFADGAEVWAQTDIERWATSTDAEPWIPLAPSIVSTLLDKLVCSRGGLRLPRGVQTVDVGGAAALVATIADPAREPYIVVVSANPREDHADARSRASELAKSLCGVAPVFLLGPGSIGAFSKAVLDVLGDGMDVYGGAIRTYAPGAGSEDDSPYRHRLAVYRRLERRPLAVVVRLVATSILARATETPPPPIWRERVRPLLERTVGEDSELLVLFEQESAKLEQNLAELRNDFDELEQRHAEAQSDNIELLTEADRLQARVTYLQTQLAKHDGAAAYAELADDPFEAIFCSEVVDEAKMRLSRLVFADSVREGAEALDEHADESWARKAWSALQALNEYASAKADGFAGDFLAYVDSPQDGAKIPKSWIGRHESKMTMANSRFRELRTLPIAVEVDPSEKILMEEHIKIEQGGTPSPRIHFYDDTGGSTKKIHVGWFGDHLDSAGKS